MFASSIVASPPKPGWLAQTNTLWPQWRLEGEALRHHVGHGRLGQIEGIDFEHEGRMGMRDERDPALVPQRRVHEFEARLARGAEPARRRFG